MVYAEATAQAAASIIGFFRPVKIEDGSAPDAIIENGVKELLLSPKEKVRDCSDSRKPLVKEVKEEWKEESKKRPREEGVRREKSGMQWRREETKAFHAS